MYISACMICLVHDILMLITMIWPMVVHVANRAGHDRKDQMGQFPRKLPHGYIIKCYKNASRVNRYNFPTVNAIDFLLSKLHTTPFHYGKPYFGALH